MSTHSKNEFREFLPKTLSVPRMYVRADESERTKTDAFFIYHSPRGRIVSKCHEAFLWEYRWHEEVQARGAVYPDVGRGDDCHAYA